MKKLLKLFIFTIFFILCFGIPINDFVFADAIIIPNSSTGIVDENLYDALLTEVNAELSEENKITQLYENSLLNISDGILNLSNKNISSLQGLNRLISSNIFEINLSYNDITEIAQNELLGFTNLKKLSISNNKLNTVDISKLTKLEELNLSNNRLSSIDLSKMVGNSLNYSSTIKLNNNLFDDFSKIKLPKETITAYNIDLRFNKLNNYLSPTSIHKFDIGIQNVLNNAVAVSDVKISLFEVLEDYDLCAKIYTNNQSLSYLTQLNSINNNITLSVAGDYVIKFFDSNLEITNDEKFKLISFKIKPNTPVIKIEIDGVEYSEIEKLTKESTIKFYGAGLICFKVNDSEWYQANSLTLTERGIYNVSVKCVQNNIESATISFTIPLEYPSDSIKRIVGFVILSLFIILFGYLAVNYRKGIGFLKKKNAKNKNNK